MSICIQRRWKVWNSRFVLCLTMLLLMFTAPAITQAHPLGNFTINHYSRLEISPGQVHLFYVLDVAEIPAFQAIQEMDHDGDDQANANERAAYAAAKTQELQKDIQLTINDQPVHLALVDAPELTFPPGQGGLSLLRLTFQLVGSLPESGQKPLRGHYQDSNDLERIGWREIVVQGHDGLSVLDATVSDRDQSNELRTYPQDMLSSPLNQVDAQFSIQYGSIEQTTSGSGVPQLGTASNDGAFAALITLPRLDLPIVLVALASALGLGALHALEPGHGKTAAAAYLVGARATPLHAALLGLTITAMHTSSVFAIGLVTLFASQYILPEQLLPWLGLASGLIVIAIGIKMFLSRVGGGLSGQHVGHEHLHGHDHDTDHNQPHIHSHDDDLHDHSQHHHIPAALIEGSVTWRGVLAIGVSGGLLPCPAALVVLLSAIGLGRIGFGMLLIVAFSAGLAIVLTCIGLAVLVSRGWIARHASSFHWMSASLIGRLAQYLPAITGLLVVGAGGLLLYHALPLLRIWHL